LSIIDSKTEFLGFADAETAPIDFSIAPSLAIPKVKKSMILKIIYFHSSSF
jgi:hypothetical protein